MERKAPEADQPMDAEAYRNRPVMTVEEVLANVREIGDRADAMYEPEAKLDPLALGWQHMQEARGWK